MADFILHTIVSGIYDAYEALPGGREPLSRDDDGNPQFGNLEKARSSAVGKTVWMLQSGNFGSALLTVSTVSPEGEAEDSTAAYQALCRFLVWMWVPDLQTGWTQMVDLVAAMRSTVYGPNLGLQNFTIPTELEGRVLHAGTEVFVLDVTLSVPIPTEGSVEPTRVPLESHQSTITEDDGTTDVDGNYAPFETVVVTGPPA